MNLPKLQKPPQLAIERMVFACPLCSKFTEIMPDTRLTYETLRDGRIAFHFTSRRIPWLLMLKTRVNPPECRLIWIVLVDGSSFGIEPPVRLRANWNRKTLTTIEKVRIHL